MDNARNASTLRFRHTLLQLARSRERNPRVVPSGQPFDFLRREHLSVISQRVLQRINDVIANDFRRAFIVEHGAKRFERGHRFAPSVEQGFYRTKKIRSRDRQKSSRSEARSRNLPRAHAPFPPFPPFPSFFERERRRGREARAG